jgi:type I restriction enzyme S subunit
VNNTGLDVRALLINFGFPKLPKDWEIKRLSDFLSQDRGISVGVMYPGKHDPTGVKLLRVSDLINDRINPNPEFKITAKVNHEYRRTILEGGELLISLVGDVGRVAVVPYWAKGWNPARAIAVLRFLNPDDAEFVRLVLQTKSLKKIMFSWSNTTVQTTLNLKEIKELPIPYPPANQRKAIVSILSAFDDKIELNRRMNRTLEAMAKALFKSWFVDFEPVRAKMRGEQPEGMDAETAALFPDEMVEVDGREVPRGWELKPVGYLCEAVQNGGTPKRLHDDFWVDGSINWFKTGELTDSFLFESEEKITEAGLKGSSTKLFPIGTVLIAIYAAPTVGRLGILTQPSASNQACSALIPKPEVESYYLWHTLFEARKWLNTVSVGAAQQNISKAVVENILALVPPDKILKFFNQEIRQLWDAQKSSLLEIARLERLRDALLPRLLSGEIDVTNWEERA